MGNFKVFKDKIIRFLVNNNLFQLRVSSVNILIIIVVAALAAFIMLYSNKERKLLVAEDKYIKFTAPSTVLDNNSMWREGLIDQMLEEKEQMENKIGNLGEEIEVYKESFKGKVEEEINQYNNEILKQIQSLRRENMDLKQKFKFLEATIEEEALKAKEENKNDHEVEQLRRKQIQGINVINVNNKSTVLPANTFAQGVLLHGVDISTASSQSSNPMPILIRLTGDGNLPHGFTRDLTGCRIRGAAVGSLSDERMHIRLEFMTCVHKKTSEIVETEVTGYVTGEDGKEGLRGEIISRNETLLRNSFVGGTLGGLVSSSKKQSSNFLLKDGLGFIGNIKEGALSGVESSMDRLSKYYVERAEQIQPVIEIEAGRKVEVIFTSTVNLGEKGLKEKIGNERKSEELWK